MPIQRERVAETIWVFTSNLYIEVTAGLIVTEEGGILIDTLPFPHETRQIADFVRRVCPAGIRYVVLTHSHADHCYGAYLFPNADVIGHRRCRELLARVGQKGLDEAKAETPELAEVKLVLPQLTFNEGLLIRLGDKTLHLFHSPGHSPDVIAAHVREDKVLFASDTLMPVPYIVGGDVDDLIASLRFLETLQLENVVQGHGPVLLRGEINDSIEANIAYLRQAHESILEMARQGIDRHSLAKLPLEKFGKSRILLGGLAPRLHEANLLYLWEKANQEVARAA